MNEKQLTGDNLSDSGSSASHNGWDSETPGSDSISNGNSAIGGDASGGKPKWFALAAALATVVFIVAELIGEVTGNGDKVRQLENEISQRSQQRGAEIKDLRDSVDEVHDTLKDIPTEMPSLPPIIVQPGQPGKSATIIVPSSSPQPTRTILITPSPTPRPTPTPAPGLLDFVIPPKR